MNRWLLILGLSALLPWLGGCALFHSNPVPPAPTLTGIKAENQAWRDAIRHGPHGGLPVFEPLAEAKQAVKAAKAQPQVENYDDKSLQQAQQALAKAEQDWRHVGKKRHRPIAALAKVADEAHRAKRLAEIAQYTAQREIGLKKLHTLQAEMTRQAPKPAQPAHLGHIKTAALIGKRVVPLMLGSLQFQAGTARLTQKSHPVIGRLAKLLATHPKVGVGIFGFTDNSEPPADRLQAFINANPQLKKQHLTHAQKVKAYHQGLSQARAHDVAQLLVQAGVDANRIGTRGMGASHPIASNKTASGRARNGRAEAIIVPLKKNGRQGGDQSGD